MRLGKRIRLVLLCVILVTIACFQWMCSTEKIGLQEPSQTPIGEIIGELANAKTQSEAELAIEHLFQKTGVGRPIKGSRYSDFNLSDDFVSDLAESHMHFLNDNDYALNWGEVFEIEGDMPDDEWLAPIAFEDVVTRFQEQATAALENPAEPDNAFLLALAAEGGTVPNTIRLFEETDDMSPVRDFLFTVWMNFEFQMRGSSNGAEIDTSETFKFISLDCEGDDDDDDDDIGEKIKDKVTIVFDAGNTELEECLDGADDTYKAGVKKCFRLGNSKDKEDCEDINACLAEKRAIAEQFIDLCLFHFHDQGGGN